MHHPTPTIPIIGDYDQGETVERLHPTDWLFATDFIARFLRTY
jgi:hypothetical protein